MQNGIKKITSGRRWLWIVGAIIVIGIAIFAYTRLTAGTRRSSAQTQVQTAKVQTGDISGTVTATGHLQAHQSVSLSLQTSGVVKELDVKVGDKVTAGQTLLKLDNSDAQLNLQSAQNALAEAQLNAQAAQVTYNSDAGYKPSDSSLASAVANANNAAAAVQAAQANYDRIATRPSISSTSESLALAQATNNYVSAKASLDSLLTSRPNLATPKINLDLANLKVSDAQIALATAQSALDRTTLVAPFDGTITAVAANAEMTVAVLNVSSTSESVNPLSAA